MIKKRQDLSKFPVQHLACRTCPFAGENPLPLTDEARQEYFGRVLNLQSQHLCHSVDNSAICRGGRDLMLRVLCLRGMIEAPTDEAFNSARDIALAGETAL